MGGKFAGMDSSTVPHPLKSVIAVLDHVLIVLSPRERRIASSMLRILLLFLHIWFTQSFVSWGSAARAAFPRPRLLLRWRPAMTATTGVVGGQSSAVAAAEAVVDGITKVVSSPGQGELLSNGAVVVVRYTGTVGGTVFGASDKMTVTVGDGTMVSGWDLALKSMSIGERAEFFIGPQHCYGAAGIPPVIPPRAELKFDVEVLDNRGNMITDATFADSSPLTPRTPKTIKAEFERRQAERAPEKEGLEGFVDWAKSIYVFGFFEATDGEELPWYLQPLITFPAMFALVV